MSLRIVLDEAGGAPALPLFVRTPGEPATQIPVTLLDGHSAAAGRPLLLYLPDEPAVGRRFRYQDLEWEVVEYRNGWLARLVVDEA